MKLPGNIGTIHFIGIGGIGMNGIAEMLHRMGYQLRGSDRVENANVARLRALGITIVVGHAPENLGDAKIVVISSAIKADNCELRAARARRLPVVRRAEMLAELMRFRRAIAVAGSHGKTTTTSLVAALLDAAGLDPTAIVGGIVNAYGASARIGSGEHIVVEADESDGTFTKLPVDYAIITNIDPEHLDHYGDFDALRAAFRQFAENVPFYGRIILCADSPALQHLARLIGDREILTYGENPQADIRIEDVSFAAGSAHFSLRPATSAAAQTGIGDARALRDLTLPMMGAHNVANAAGAVALALSLGIPGERLRAGLAGFAGIRRRFSLLGEANGISIYDDYAHHPVEIAATLRAARLCGQRVIAVMQPHRFSRLQTLFNEFCAAFNDADTVIVVPVFAAGERPLEGFDHLSLARGIAACRHRDARAASDFDDMSQMLGRLARPGDAIVFLGAGSITAWAADYRDRSMPLQEDEGAGVS